jgi:MSHA biogenesis protein MshJ
MKLQLIRWSEKIDALSLRERAMVFAAAAASMLFIAWYGLLDPLFIKQAALRAQLSEQRSNIAGIDAEITQKVQAFAADPDIANRARLAALNTEVAQLGANLRAMQKGLLAPERVAPLLGHILKSHGRLRLLSMKTLPVSSLSDGGFGNVAHGPALGGATLVSQVAQPRPEAGAAPVPAAAAMAPDLLYRHGVQLAVLGNYLDMVDYMSALEAMPTQLFWGKAQLDVDEYPNARLTLTLYTLSLDPKWMKL